ncbi:MAG TPA: DUF2187 domain-containing protein [Tetragenococcus sp.]|nr:DUF2187 domain-containing protein [Tetragenococcus sp.]
MGEEAKVSFVWENTTLFGQIEKEYENSFLVKIDEPTKEIMDSFNGRMIVSKKKIIKTEKD